MLVIFICRVVIETIMTSSVKTIFVTALKEEAKPLISFFKLQKSQSIHRMEVFENQNIILVCSGVGKCASSASTAFAASMLSHDQDAIAINVGIAGTSPSSECLLKTPYLINKITDNSSKREFFPDMISNISLDEASLTTVDFVVSDQVYENLQSGLIDMEGSGFFEAASMFFPPHNIACLKIASDHLRPDYVSKKIISELSDFCIPSLCTIIDSYCSLARFYPKRLKSSDCVWINKVAYFLRLTVSQKNILSELVLRRRVQINVSLPNLIDIFPLRPKSSEERRTCFDKLQKLLIS